MVWVQYRYVVAMGFERVQTALGSLRPVYIYFHVSLELRVCDEFSERSYVIPKTKAEKATEKTNDTGLDQDARIQSPQLLFSEHGFASKLLESKNHARWHWARGKHIFSRFLNVLRRYGAI